VSFSSVVPVGLQTVSRLADTAVTLGVGDEGAMPYFSACKGLAEYRRGRYAEAAEWSRKPLESPSVNAHGYACAVLAMAEWRLGQAAARPGGVGQRRGAGARRSPIQCG